MKKKDMKLHRDLCNKREKRQCKMVTSTCQFSGAMTKTWTRFNIDKETRVYTMTYKCRVGDKMARPLLSVPVSWSTLKSHGDRKSGLPLRIQKSNSG